MQKVFRITVDISKKIPAPAFEVNTNDLKSVKLEITITNGQSLLDLTGITPRINIRKPDNEVIFQDCEIVDAAAGKVEIILENQAYLVPGTHTAEIACYKGNEITAITGTFSYKSVKGIMNDKAVESKSEFTAIDRKIEEARKLLEDIGENGVGVDEQARQEIQEVSERLADTKQLAIQNSMTKNFRCIIVSDTHMYEGEGQGGISSPQRMEVLKQKLLEEHSKEPLSFVLIDGDVGHNETTLQKGKDGLVYMKQNVVDALPFPVMCLHGNHDNTDENRWFEIFKHSKEFNYQAGEIVFVCHDTFKEPPLSGSNRTDYRYTKVDPVWLQTQLTKFANKKVILVTHGLQPADETSELESVFRNATNLIGVIDGHTHEHTSRTWAGKTIYSCGHFSYPPNYDWTTGKTWGYREIKLKSNGDLTTKAILIDFVYPNVTMPYTTKTESKLTSIDITKLADYDINNNATSKIEHITKRLEEKPNQYGWKSNQPKGTITLQFDDFYKSWYNNAYKPILKDKGVPFSIPFSIDEIANTSRADFMNQAELDEVFADKNAEFLWHARSHVTFDDKVTKAVLQDHIDKSIDYFKSKNIKAYGWVAPNTRFDPDKLNMMAKYFNFGWAEDYRVTNYDNFYKAMDKNKSQHMINRISMDYHNNMSDAKIRQGLNDVLNGGWLTLYAHRIGETVNNVTYCPASFIQQIIDWANANNVEILNPSDAFIKHNANNVALKYPLINVTGGGGASTRAYLKDVPVINITAANTETMVLYNGGAHREIENVGFLGGVATIQHKGIYEVRMRFIVSNVTNETIGRNTYRLNLYKNDTVFDDARKQFKDMLSQDYEEIVYRRTLELKQGDTLKFMVNSQQLGLTVSQSSSIMEIRKIS